MRIVIFSDIHGNVVALEAVLTHIRRKTAPDMIIVAGDLVASGPRPAEALALLRNLSGARFVIGNTDQDILRDQDAATQFTRSRLTTDDLEWLAELPFSQKIEAAPGRALLVVHANPSNLHDSIQPDTRPSIVRPLFTGVAQEIIAFGHYHVPFIRMLDTRTLVNVASVGMPRDGVPRAVYVTLTFDGQEWQIAHHRISFDIQSVAQDYTTVGFPEAHRMANRLLALRY